MGTGGRWVRGKGGDGGKVGKGKGKERKTRRKIRAKKVSFPKHCAILTHTFPFFGWYDIFTLPTPCVRYPSALRYCGVVTSPKGRPYGWLPNMVPC